MLVNVAVTPQNRAMFGCTGTAAQEGEGAAPFPQLRIVGLACELLAWTQMLAFTGPARRWEPKRLRLRIFAVVGRVVRGSRRLRLRLARCWPWAAEITTAITRLQAMTPG